MKATAGISEIWSDVFYLLTVFLMLWEAYLLLLNVEFIQGSGEQEV